MVPAGDLLLPGQFRMELVQSRTPLTTASHAEGSDSHQITDPSSDMSSLNKAIGYQFPKRQVKNTLNHGHADGEEEAPSQTPASLL
jgi:hypothetical protein